MAHLIGLSGSLRAGSYNSALLREAAQLAPSGSEIAIHSIRGVPLYDGDVEAREGTPEVVARLKDAVAAADGLLLVTPEYNNSIPGVFKNAIDWMSRPPSDTARVFGNKPVAVIGASIGPFGTVLSQNAWLAVLRFVGAAPWFGGRLLVRQAAGVFDAGGHLADQETKERLRRFVAGFCDYADGLSGGRN